MCGRFTQIKTRYDYLEFLASELEFNGALDPVPIGRYNVAAGTRVLILNQREDDGFVIVTADSDSGLVDIHDRRPVVLPPDAAREWMNPDTSPERAKEIALEALTSAEEFDWHPVIKKVGNIRNNGPELIEPLDALFHHSPDNR
ncbi:SOS response-associated peptidase family protein [Yersinia sp. 2540 StPb PI]|uniref:SOS response-associated peptidase family protein n=1 Tax=Yersinia sp. 2540 StPb PI TaxID=3117406 RepID=UPI003FA461F3